MESPSTPRFAAQDKTVALKDFEDGSGPADGLSLRSRRIQVVASPESIPRIVGLALDGVWRRTKWHAPNIIQTNVSSAGQPLLSELFDSQTWRDNVQESVSLALKTARLVNPYPQFQVGRPPI